LYSSNIIEIESPIFSLCRMGIGVNMDSIRIIVIMGSFMEVMVINMGSIRMFKEEQGAEEIEVLRMVVLIPS